MPRIPMTACALRVRGDVTAPACGTHLNVDPRLRLLRPSQLVVVVISSPPVRCSRRSGVSCWSSPGDPATCVNTPHPYLLAQLMGLLDSSGFCAGCLWPVNHSEASRDAVGAVIRPEHLSPAVDEALTAGAVGGCLYGTV
ncbi:hypothetical protein AOLI_G00176740 [Acnodon oligacanthus]